MDSCRVDGVAEFGTAALSTQRTPSHEAPNWATVKGRAPAGFLWSSHWCWPGRWRPQSSTEVHATISGHHLHLAGRSAACKPYLYGEENPRGRRCARWCGFGPRKAQVPPGRRQRLPRVSQSPLESTANRPPAGRQTPLERVQELAGIPRDNPKCRIGGGDPPRLPLEGSVEGVPGRAGALFRASPGCGPKVAAVLADR